MNHKIHDPGNDAPINALYAWISVDDEGNEGIVAKFGPLPMPLVSGSLDLMKVHKIIIDSISHTTKKKIVLKKFVVTETLIVVEN